MVPKWLTSYLANSVINQWSTAFCLISNPLVFEVLYLAKYLGGFRYFISHNIKNRFKNAVTLCLGRTRGSLGLVQWHASILWQVTSLFLDQFLHILSTG